MLAPGKFILLSSATIVGEGRNTRVCSSCMAGAVQPYLLFPFTITPVIFGMSETASPYNRQENVSVISRFPRSEKAFPLAGKAARLAETDEGRTFRYIPITVQQISFSVGMTIDHPQNAGRYRYRKREIGYRRSG